MTPKQHYAAQLNKGNDMLSLARCITCYLHVSSRSRIADLELDLKIIKINKQNTLH